MTTDLIPVHVSERRGHVSVVMLVDLPGGGMARYEGDVWKEIGIIHPTVIRERDRFQITRKREMFAWYYQEPDLPELAGHEKTRAKALAAILDAGGYYEVPDTATIPSLFDFGS